MISSQATNESVPSLCMAAESDFENLQQPSFFFQRFLIMYITINIVTVPFTAVLNALVMIAVKTKSQLRAQKSNVVLAILSVTDFLVGILAQPIFIAGIVFILLQESNGQSCVTEILSFAIANSLFTSSLLHLVLASGERYVAIKHPFQYTFIVTEARLLFASLLAWLLSVTVHILLAADAVVFFSVNSTVIGLSFAIIVFCHSSVYFETRRHEHQIAVQQLTQEARKHFEKDRKAFKQTSIIIGALILCCTPLIFCRSVLFQLYRPSLNTFHIIIFFATTVVFFNSLLNPVIYCIRSRRFLVAFIELTFRKVNFAKAEEIERQWFGEPNAANRREAGQVQGRQDQENVERANVQQNNTNAG